MAVLAYREADSAYVLEFDPTFFETGHDLSPLNLPIEQQRNARVFRRGDSPFDGGLPGLITDSLPDAWGQRVLAVEMPEVRSVLGKLASIGRRGPGAITFEPAVGPGRDDVGTEVNLSRLAASAAALFAKLPTDLSAPLTTPQINLALAKGGSSLGGAYPKTTAHLPLAGETIEKREILIGGPTPTGYAPCVLKFSPADDEGGGAVEFAYLKMAHAAGIQVPRACLVFDGERRHFAVERFDRYRKEDGTIARRHVQTLSALLHLRASERRLDYTHFMRLTRTLCSQADAVECFRRTIFNLLAVNRDDHGRNHAFVYDDVSRQWGLSPAYDLNPSVATVLISLSWFEGDTIPKKFSEIVRYAELGGISRSVARSIFGEVEAAVNQWPKLATQYGVPKGTVDIWAKEIAAQTKELRADVNPPGGVARGRGPKKTGSAAST